MIDISDPPPSKKRDRQRDKREREREKEKRNQTWERGGRANKNIRMVLREGR